MMADIWATALSVLGEDGFDMLPAEVDALLVLGPADDFRIVCTQGLRSMIEGPAPARFSVIERNQVVTEASAKQSAR
jgi:hypothetical protein